jgi:hypothetical protein
MKDAKVMVWAGDILRHPTEKQFLRRDMEVDLYIVPFCFRTPEKAL